MLEVKGMPIIVDEMEILETIREQVLQQQGREILHKIKRSGNNIMVCCPVHNEGQERKPSCGISIVKRKDYPVGTWNCFACGEKGPFELFVAKCFGRDDMAFGTKWLLENFVTGESYERPTIPIDIERFDILKREEKKVEYVTEEELASYRFYHPYMWQRKLTPEIVEKYDVGYQRDYRLPIKKDDGTIEYGNPVECLTFPVRDKNGNCLFVSRRAIYNKNFFLPPDIEKPVYGIYELPPNCTNAVICESVFNALTCVAYGRPALALFGTGTDWQMNYLNKLSIKHYTLATDNDYAGRKARYKIRKALKNKIITEFDYNSYAPDCNDINDMTLEQFQSLREIYPIIKI